MTEKVVLQIEITRQQDGRTRIMLDIDDIGPEVYGLLVADIVRHGGKAFGCPEELIWEWVDKEREHPTTPIITLKPN